MAKTPTEDSFYEKQIAETNKLGNALLSELVAEKIVDFKRRLAGRIQINEDIKNYQKAVAKLRSLRIAHVHQVLKIKEENDPSMQIERGEQLIAKIEQILQDNVCYDASGVISKEEFDNLKSNFTTLQSVNEALCDVPDTSESKLQTIKQFSQTITQILDKIELLESSVKEYQSGLIKSTAEVINYM